MTMAIGIVIASLFPLPLLSQSRVHNTYGLEDKDDIQQDSKENNM